MKTVRLTMTQALVRHLAALRVELNDGTIEPYCGGVFAIFGHGNVAGLGEALWQIVLSYPLTARTTSKAWLWRLLPTARRSFVSASWL